ncbi:MAG: helix-turn-helix transcriptional regulator [Eubacteriales bacterium]|nr:helix-turn-helix transcriptional regulator [Eubacteriales bacterium]
MILTAAASSGRAITAIIATVLIAVMYLVRVAIVAGGIYLLVLSIKALRKYISSKEVRDEKALITRSLAEILKENRIRCKMTQEFVSEAIGVSRQAVSKWENGTSDPSTSNLIALARLYGISAEDLLRGAAEVHKEEE